MRILCRKISYSLNQKEEVINFHRPSDRNNCRAKPDLTFSFAYFVLIHHMSHGLVSFKISFGVKIF